MVLETAPKVLKGKPEPQIYITIIIITTVITRCSETVLYIKKCFMHLVGPRLLRRKEDVLEIE